MNNRNNRDYKNGGKEQTIEKNSDHTNEGKERTIERTETIQTGKGTKNTNNRDHTNGERDE